MRAAVGTHNLGSCHSHIGIRCRFYVAASYNVIEPRPAGPTLKLRVAPKQRGPTGNAYVCAWLMVVRIFAGEGRLRTFQKADVVLLGREFFLHVRRVHSY